MLLSLLNLITPNQHFNEPEEGSTRREPSLGSISSRMHHIDLTLEDDGSDVEFEPATNAAPRRNSSTHVPGAHLPPLIPPSGSTDRVCINGTWYVHAPDPRPPSAPVSTHDRYAEYHTNNALQVPVTLLNARADILMGRGVSNKSLGTIDDQKMFAQGIKLGILAMEARTARGKLSLDMIRDIRSSEERVEATNKIRVAKGLPPLPMVAAPSDWDRLTLNAREGALPKFTLLGGHFDPKYIPDTGDTGEFTDWITVIQYHHPYLQMLSTLVATQSQLPLTQSLLVVAVVGAPVRPTVTPGARPAAVPPAHPIVVLPM